MYGIIRQALAAVLEISPDSHMSHFVEGVCTPERRASSCPTLYQVRALIDSSHDCHGAEGLRIAEAWGVDAVEVLADAVEADEIAWADLFDSTNFALSQVFDWYVEERELQRKGYL